MLPLMVWFWGTAKIVGEFRSSLSLFLHGNWSFVTSHCTVTEGRYVYIHTHIYTYSLGVSLPFFAETLNNSSTNSYILSKCEIINLFVKFKTDFFLISLFCSRNAQRQTCWAFLQNLTFVNKGVHFPKRKCMKPWLILAACWEDS